MVLLLVLKYYYMVLNIDHFSVENHKPQKRIQLYKLPSLTHDFYRDWPSADDSVYFCHYSQSRLSCTCHRFLLSNRFFSWNLLFLISRYQSSPQQLFSPCSCLLWEPKLTGKLQRPSAVDLKQRRWTRSPWALNSLFFKHWLHRRPAGTRLTEHRQTLAETVYSAQRK